MDGYQLMWRNEERKCAFEECSKPFFPNAHNQKFCSEKCKQDNENKRWYAAHRTERIKQVVEHRRKRRKAQQKQD